LAVNVSVLGWASREFEMRRLPISGNWKTKRSDIRVWQKAYGIVGRVEGVGRSVNG
jgi:hypothetical protein